MKVTESQGMNLEQLKFFLAIDPENDELFDASSWVQSMEHAVKRDVVLELVAELEWKAW